MNSISGRQLIIRLKPGLLLAADCRRSHQLKLVLWPESNVGFGLVMHFISNKRETCSDGKRCFIETEFSGVGVV